MNASRGKAGMDEAIMSGLRERVHPGLPPPYRTRFMNNAGYMGFVIRPSAWRSMAVTLNKVGTIL